MQLLIDSIHEFYNDAENLAAFEEWKERKNKMRVHRLRAAEKRAKRRALREEQPKDWQLLLFTAGMLWFFFEVGYWWCTGEVLKW